MSRSQGLQDDEQWPSTQGTPSSPVSLQSQHQQTIAHTAAATPSQQSKRKHGEIADARVNSTTPSSANNSSTSSNSPIETRSRFARRQLVEQQQQQQQQIYLQQQHSVINNTSPSAASLLQVRKKVRFADASEFVGLFPSSADLLCEESIGHDQHQILIDSVSALSDKQLTDLLRDVKAEATANRPIVKSEPLSFVSSNRHSQIQSPSLTPPVTPIVSPPASVASNSSSSSSSTAVTTTTNTATHNVTTAVFQFNFNLLPAIARRRILKLLKNEAPQAPCVCLLWSQLLSDDTHELCEWLVTRERLLQAAYVRSVRQAEIKREMIPMLIDWLVDVGEEFELRPITLHTAVAYLRWHLAHNQVRKSELQLLGATCMFVAAKYHEREADVPDLRDFVYMGDSVYTIQAILSAEIKLVHSLDFELQPTTPIAFLHLYCDTLHVRPHSDPQVFWMAMHLLELSLLRTSTQRLRPSVAAAAALHIAIATRIGVARAIDVWDGSLYMLTGLTPSHAPMSHAVVSVFQLRVNPPTVPNNPLTAINAKYAQLAYAHVANIPLLPNAPIPP